MATGPRIGGARARRPRAVRYRNRTDALREPCQSRDPRRSPAHEACGTRPCATRRSRRRGRRCPTGRIEMSNTVGFGTECLARHERVLVVDMDHDLGHLRTCSIRWPVGHTSRSICEASRDLRVVGRGCEPVRHCGAPGDRFIHRCPAGDRTGRITSFSGIVPVVVLGLIGVTFHLPQNRYNRHGAGVARSRRCDRAPARERRSRTSSRPAFVRARSLAPPVPSLVWY